MTSNNKKRKYGDIAGRILPDSSNIVSDVFDRLVGKTSQSLETPISSITESSLLSESSHIPQSSQVSQSSLLSQSNLPDVPVADQADQLVDQIDRKDLDNSLLPQSSLLTDNTPAYSESSLLEQSSQLQESRLLSESSQKKISLWDGAQVSRGHLRIPNTYLDHICKILDPLEQACYLQLYRLSWGYGKDNCNISLPSLASRANLSRATAQRVIVKLIEKGIVEKLEINIGYGKEQGVSYRLPIPSSLLRESSLLSESSLLTERHNKDLKKKINKNKLQSIISHFRQINVGRSYSIGELAEDCKLACAREGLAWDNDLFDLLTR